MLMTCTMAALFANMRWPTRCFVRAISLHGAFCGFSLGAQAVPSCAVLIAQVASSDSIVGGGRFPG